VGDLTQIRAERDDELDPEQLDKLDHRVGVGPPTKVRLRSSDDHHVRSARSRARDRETRCRPEDPASRAVNQGDLGANFREVKELVRIDLGEWERLPLPREVARGVRRCFASIIPALECRDQNRISQLGSIGVREHLRALASTHERKL